MQTVHIMLAKNQDADPCYRDRSRHHASGAPGQMAQLVFTSLSQIPKQNHDPATVLSKRCETSLERNEIVQSDICDFDEVTNVEV